MAQERLHVVTHEQGWALKREGEESVVSVYPTQREAIEAGKDRARKDLTGLVIHRSDGTFRQVMTFNDGAVVETDDAAEETVETREGSAMVYRNDTDARVRGHDVFSVGSRVSWGAILAGAVLASATFIVLSLLGAAFGLSIADKVEGSTLFNTAAIWTFISALVALFVGGFVASRVTAGEDRVEAAQYGLLVWGTLLLAVPLMARAGTDYGLGRLTGWNGDATATARASAPALEPEKEQAIEDATKGENRLSATGAAWLAFVGVLLSLAAAVGGALAGAGPELFPDRRRVVRTEEREVSEKVTSRARGETPSRG